MLYVLKNLIPIAPNDDVDEMLGMNINVILMMMRRLHAGAEARGGK